MRLRQTLLIAFSLMAVSAPAQALMEDYPSIKLQGLDKSVGRTVTFEAKVGSTIQYGPLYIKIHACRKAPPIETPESAAFLQIWEVPPGADKSEWVFSGWMFASSPALSAMDHPVYDVWVLDCTGREEPNEEAQAAETEEEADQTALPSADEENPIENEVELSEDILEGAAAQDNDPVIMPDTQTPLPKDAAPFDPYAPTPRPQDRQPQEAPVPTPTPDDPTGEGIYSPSQGRVVPVQPQNPYGRY